MKGMGEIFKKEIVRVFKDPKMVLSIFVLPVVLMIGLLYLMGNVMTNMQDDIASHKSIIYIENQPDSFQQFLKECDIEGDIRPIKELEQVKKEIRNGDADVLLVFPKEFDEQIQTYQVGNKVPEIQTFYNPSEEYSSAARNVLMGVLEKYRNTLLAGRVGNLEQLMVFTVNSESEEVILQDDKKAEGKALGTMLPYFVTLMLFAGAMSIGTDMIAGEKERGTMASLLVSPVKRSAIIFGKVFALMTISGLASVVSTIAIIVCMPLVSQSMLGETVSGVGMKLDTEQIWMLGTLLVAVAFLYATIIALVSVFAKTVKEANSYVMPVYILVLAIGIMTMYMTGEPSKIAYYIPIYNSAIVLKGIFVHEVAGMQFLITLLTTLVSGLILTGIIAKAFDSEKVMAG